MGESKKPGGRPSKLSDAQWVEIQRRLALGEKATDLAREFKVSKTAISVRFSKRTETIKSVAQQVVSAEAALLALPVSEQKAAVSLIEELRTISTHMAGAARYGSATAHRLLAIANAKVQEIDDADPLNAEGVQALKSIALVTKVANESAVIPTNLLSANKDLMKGGDGDKSNADILRQLAESLPD
jgi:ribosomal protein S11